MITNLEAVNAAVGFTSPNQNIPVKAIMDLKDTDITPEGVYDPENSNKIDWAAIATLMAFKVIAKIDQGGFGVTFDSDAADENIRFLKDRSGFIEPVQGSDQPNIYNVQNRW